MKLKYLVLRSANFEVVTSDIKFPQDLDRIAREALDFTIEANANHGRPDYFGHTITYNGVSSVFHTNQPPQDIIRDLARAITIVNERRRS